MQTGARKGREARHAVRKPEHFFAASARCFFSEEREGRKAHHGVNFRGAEWPRAHNARTAVFDILPSPLHLSATSGWIIECWVWRQSEFVFTLETRSAVWFSFSCETNVKWLLASCFAVKPMWRQNRPSSSHLKCWNINWYRGVWRSEGENRNSLCAHIRA